MISEREDRKMDKKQVSRIVTKYKVPILITIFLLFLVIVSAFSNSSLEQQEEKKQTFSMEERKQLIDMTTYLNEIDEVVTMNQERLAEATLFQSDAEHLLNIFQERLSVLENALSQVEAMNQKHIETETSSNSDISVFLTALSENQQEIKAQIIAVNTSIATIVSEIKAENNDNFLTTFEKLGKLETDLEKMQKDTSSYYESLTKLITLLQEDNNSQYGELTNTLLTVQADFTGVLNKGFETLRLQLDEDFTALMNKLNALHGQIADTKDFIADLLMLMEEKNMDRHEEIKAAFTSVSTSLELIQSEYTDAYAELQNLIQKVLETQNVNHKETVSVLTIMENNMKETSLENLNQITASLQTMEEKFFTSISNIQGEIKNSFSTLDAGISNYFTQMNDSIMNQFKELNSDISDQCGNISSTIINNNDSQQEDIDNLKNLLMEKLQQVFQYVSNGKQKCASALLTKGINMKADAAFEEIYQGILAIPQQLVIGVQEIPGTISYDYHYHEDGAGNQPHVEKVAVSGGCYNIPFYHVHEGSASIRGGCYTTPVYHSHASGCYREVGSPEYGCHTIRSWDTSEGDWAGHDYKYYEMSCGRTIHGTNSYHTHSVLDCSQGGNIVSYSVGCGKNERTIEGYCPDCGLCDGQIIGAHIIYDANKLKEMESEQASTGQAESEEVESEQASIGELELGQASTEQTVPEEMETERLNIEQAESKQADTVSGNETLLETNNVQEN